MTPIARPEPPGRGRRRMRPAPGLGARVARALLGALLSLAVVLPGIASATSTWTKNLYVARAFLYQDPYPTACTAAAAMIMLNTIAYRGAGGNGFEWAPTRIKSDADPADTDDMLSIFAFARAHDSLVGSARGSDPHGWRNALNAYGWGADAMTDPAKRVYDDRAYTTFNGAVRAAVRAIARKSMPVGILGWAGGHAQVMTGYVVTGADPAVSNDFTVTYVYLSDPLSSNSTVNRRISLAAFRSGPLARRFQAYRQTDSPYDDPYTPGYLRSSVSPDRGPSEWYHRWVVILPVRPGLPAPDPTPTPTPTPDLGASDSPAPTPTPKAGDAAAASPAPQPTPTPAPTATPTPAPTATPGPTPKPDPTASPTPAPTPSPTPTPEPTPTPSPDPTADPSPDASPAG